MLSFTSTLNTIFDSISEEQFKKHLPLSPLHNLHRTICLEMLLRNICVTSQRCLKKEVWNILILKHLISISKD